MMAIFLPHIYSLVKYEAGQGRKTLLLSGDCTAHIIAKCLGDGELRLCSSAAER